MTAAPIPSQQTPRVPLTLGRVLEGAVALADEVGMEGFTLRKLAAWLDVKPMTIYHYVKNKEEIINGMVDLVFEEIGLPPTGIHWKDAMRARARSARAVLARHSWATVLMESRATPGPATLRHHNAVLGCLRRGGLSVTMTAHAYAIIDSFVYGFALQEANLPATEGQAITELAAGIAELFDAGQYPYLTELTAEHVLKPGYDFGAEFEFGLNLILDGIEAVDPSVS